VSLILPPVLATIRALLTGGIDQSRKKSALRHRAAISARLAVVFADIVLGRDA
jgi:hypothetical protein